MKRNHADTLAIILVTFVLVAGGIATWQAYQQWIALSDMGGHMGGAATAMHGTHPVWYALGTLLAAAVISGVYVSVRDRLVSSEGSVGVPNAAHSDPERDTQSSMDDRSTASKSVSETDSAPDREVLDLLPDDERRILQPVLDSPGLTQIELRDRSEFSKSKVSQTVSELEKRGLLYREPQGRTYRVYPADDLQDRHGGSLKRTETVDRRLDERS